MAEAKQAGKVLLYMQNQGKKEQIRQFCRKRGIETAEISYRRINTPLASLNGIPGGLQKEMARTVTAAPPFYQMPELLVFCGFMDQALDQFLKEYRLAGIEPVALKAILTPYNLFWTPYELAKELERERQEMNSKRSRR